MIRVDKPLNIRLQDRKERIKSTTFIAFSGPVSSRAAGRRARFMLANTERKTSPAGPPEDGKLAFENPSSVTATAAKQGYNIQKHAPHVDDRMKMFTSIGSWAFFFLFNNRRGITSTYTSSSTCIHIICSYTIFFFFPNSFFYFLYQRQPEEICVRPAKCEKNNINIT